MHSKLLYPPSTHPFDATHSAAAGMHVCLSPNSRCVPTDYNWCKDLLAPSINGTVMHIEHHVDSVAVYIHSDDTSHHVQPYTVEHLLHLVLPAEYTTTKLARAAGTVPAHCHISTHIPHTAHLMLATLLILLQAARCWQDTHAECSRLPALCQLLGTLSIWLHRACQQRNVQGECTGPTALRRLEGSPTASPHTATT